MLIKARSGDTQQPLNSCGLTFYGLEFKGRLAFPELSYRVACPFVWTCPAFYDVLRLLNYWVQGSAKRNILLYQLSIYARSCFQL